MNAPNRFLLFLAVKMLAMALASFAASPASAGKCYNRYCRTCYHSGYSQKTYAKDWSWKEALAKIAERKADNEAFAQGLAAVSGGGASASASVNAYGQSGPGHGYVQTSTGEFSSYPVEGNTILGVNAYANNPLVDLNATLNLQGKLAAQLADGAHGAASDTADLANTVYMLESNRQAQIAAFAAIRDVAQGAPPQPTVNTFRYQHTTQPAQGGAPFTTQGGPVTPGSTVSASASVGAPPLPGLSFESVVAGRCASCHTGAEAKGGLNVEDLDLDGLKAMVARVNLPTSDPKFMPQKLAEGQHVSGEALTWQERHAIESMLLNATAGQ
jgi:hypothetical protein